MRYIFCADLHNTYRKPNFRTEKDFFKEVCYRKMKFIAKQTQEREAFLIIGGDVFDTALVPYKVAVMVAKALRSAWAEVYSVPGQHDMENHMQNLINTPYQVLIETGAIINIHNKTVNGIQGCGWECEPVSEGADILVVHRSITPKEPPFYLKDAISAEAALKLYKDYKIILSGDFHDSFHVKKGGRLLINAGPMTRDSKDMLAYQPMIHFFDSETLEYEAIPIPIRPAEEAFDIARIQKEKEQGITLDIDTSKIVELMQSEETKIEFESVLHTLKGRMMEEQGIEIDDILLESILTEAKK